MLTLRLASIALLTPGIVLGAWLTVARQDVGEADAPLPLTVARQDAELKRHLEFARLQSRALADNLLGDSSDRELGVLLPPSYFEEPARRYPVVYLLHGLGSRLHGHLGNVGVQRRAFREMASGNLPEMIVVAVDGSTSLGGSYYARSPTIGDFETYVVREIVDAVDAKYRTVAEPSHRAIAGFSMGGHGALKLAMKHPGVFTGVGTLSASPLSIDVRRALYQRALSGHVRARDPAELQQKYGFEGAWTVASIYAKAAAFSPEPSRPPLFLALPFQQQGKRGAGAVWARWEQEDPLNLLPEHHQALRALEILYMDRGSEETILGVEPFDRALRRHGIPFQHRVFKGGHSDLYEERHLRMLQHLSARWSLNV